MKLYEYVLKFKENADSKLRKIAESSGQADTALSKIKRTIAGLAIGAALSSGVSAAVNLGIQMEQTRVSFSTFLGDAQKANEVIGQLNEFANVTPFDNAQVIKAGKGLLAFGTSADELIPTLRKIGDISAGTNKDFNELAIIYGKARIAGTLYAEDINQLVEAGIPIMGEFAKSLGVTEDQVKKMASQGKLKFKDLEQAFTNLTGEGGMFYDLMKKQSETVGGRISTFRGKLQLLGIAIGEKLLPVVGAFVDKFTPLVEQYGPMLVAWAENVSNKLMALGSWLIQNKTYIEYFAVAIGMLTTAFLTYKLTMVATTLVAKGYVIATNIARFATLLFTKGFAALNTVMKLNVFGIVVSALAAITAGVIYAWNHFEGFREVIYGVGETFKQVFTNIAEFFKRVFSPIAEAITAIREGRYLDAAKAIGKQLVNLNPVGFAIEAGKFAKEGGFTKGIAEAYAKGAQKGLDSFVKSKASDKLATISGADGSGGVLAAPEGSGDQGAKGTISNGVDTINGGGTRHTNISFQFENVVKDINMNVTNLKEGTEEVKRQVEEAMLRVLNGLNYAAN